MTTAQRFALRFSTDIGLVLRLSIPRAYADKPPAEVESTMRAMLANGIIQNANRGVASDIYRADLVTTVTRPLV
ncbi:MAG: DUF2922 domain-containing protein [Defluviitaleaceae bacterium]|nr:DUF2922 domain-containing protein [Defluviitaleaceae bacterium]